MSDKPKTEVSVRWEGGLKFTAEDGFGHSITIDAPSSHGAPFEGFKPATLLLVALAGCTAIDVVEILRKQRQELLGVEIKVWGEQEPNPPWAFTRIGMHFTLKGRNLKEERVKRAIELSETKYCSVGATISGKAEIHTTYTIEEA